MAARWLLTSLLLLFMYVQSVAVPPGFHYFLDSIEELLSDTERLINTNNPTVVDSTVGRLQCAVDTTYQLLLQVDANAATRDLSTLYQELLAILERWENEEGT